MKECKHDFTEETYCQNCKLYHKICDICGYMTTCEETEQEAEDMEREKNV